MSKTDFRKEYLTWLESNMEIVTTSSGIVRLTTPFLDSSNDCIEIFIKVDGAQLLITDAGETLSDLELTGFKMSAKRKEILNTLVSANGVQLNDNELQVMCSADRFAAKANALIQCMIKTSDMLMLTDNTVKTIFTEDVKRYLDENDIRYMQNVSFIGRSSFYANYDFVIPKSKKMPERFVIPLNAARENIIKSTIFTWEDVKPSRGKDCVLYAMVNDQDREVPQGNIAALKEYGIHCIPWSARDTILNDLSA